jgi:hypothetical protein
MRFDVRGTKKAERCETFGFFNGHFLIFNSEKDPSV